MINWLISFLGFTREVNFIKKLINLFRKGDVTKLLRPKSENLKKLVRAIKKEKLNRKHKLQMELKKKLKQQREQARLQRKNANYNVRWNTAEYKAMLSDQNSKMKAYDKARKDNFDSIGYFNNSSWIMSYARPNRLTFKGTSKWYTITGLTDALINKMKSTRSAGKFLWDTLWLHKRRWTKPKSGFSRRYSQSTLREFADVRQRVVKSGDMPARMRTSIRPIVRNDRYTKRYWAIKALWK